MHLPAALLHMRAVPSVDAVSNAFPSEENSDDTTEPLCPANMSARTPVCTFHRQAVASSEAVARKASSGENCAALTVSPWPRKVCRHSPVPTSQSLAVPSSEAVTTSVPSGENAAEVTVSRCPWRERRQSPDSASQILAVQSSEAVSTSVPSGENAAEVTVSRCPWRERRQWPVSASQIFAAPPAAVSTCLSAVFTRVSCAPSPTPMSARVLPGSNSWVPWRMPRRAHPTRATSPSRCRTCLKDHQASASRSATLVPPMVSTETRMSLLDFCVMGCP
mmetsp:Transcript_129988/g.315766  ORF Transcript_129988/g.315766 Transcript_129988/m.315766 type:complete len:277 (+) Transcript_129988:638-1468(+)